MVFCLEFFWDVSVEGRKSCLAKFRTVGHPSWRSLLLLAHLLSSFFARFILLPHVFIPSVFRLFIAEHTTASHGSLLHYAATAPNYGKLDPKFTNFGVVRNRTALMIRDLEIQIGKLNEEEKESRSWDFQLTTIHWLSAEIFRDIFIYLCTIVGYASCRKSIILIPRRVIRRGIKAGCVF